jgi:hypothetical protein
MKTLDLRCCTTEKIFNEVHENAAWVVWKFISKSYNQFELIEAGTRGYRQNLFISGYLKWSTIQGNPSLDQYMIHCLGKSYKQKLESCIKDQLTSLGISIINSASGEGILDGKSADIDDIFNEIKAVRLSNGTFTRDEQCRAEAEVVLMCNNDKAIFISQSSILNRISHAKSKSSWKPEKIYRFLTLFSSVPAKIDLLYQCMIADFIYSGFDIVDNEAVINYLNPAIRQAKMDIDQERESYKEALGAAKFAEYEDDFGKTPDELKPFYSFQLAQMVVREQAKRVEAAEDRARKAQDTKEFTEKERREFTKLKTKAAMRKARREKHKLSLKKKRKKR